ncbi:hypothetical protein O181_001209 [Austropuccinia psidii MF-1]|uniref:ubiquitinyl hydrolase 1 n=1 Tax=Austropuccinia psidii MF-1 TaxID=1389203 RepID=A0A9Q3BA24_9BASI|nr:hypothetical protein [Austropuccinia psidii MF-1]
MSSSSTSNSSPKDPNDLPVTPTSLSTSNSPNSSIPTARFDYQVLPLPPCLTNLKLLSKNFNYQQENEIWPHQIWDFEWNLKNSNWQQIVQSPTSSSPTTSNNNNNNSKYPKLSLNELLNSKPHPCSFFCPMEWCWIIIEILDQETPPRSINSVIDSTLLNHHHFFQHFPNSVDQVNLLNPIPISPFEPASSFSSSNSFNNDLQNNLKFSSINKLDARLCYHCKKGIFHSNFNSKIPSIFNKIDALELINHSKNYNHLPHHIQINSKPDQLIYKAWHTVFIVIQNALIEGKLSPLPLNGKSISGRMPWDQTSAKIWSSLGVTRKEFTNDPSINPANTASIPASSPLLVLPNLNVLTPEGRSNRAKWVRALLEISIFLKWFKTSHPHVEESTKTNYIVPINLVPALSKIAQLLGGISIPSIPMKATWQTPNGIPVAYQAYSTLGIVPTVPDQIVILAYDVQVKAFPHLRYEFFEALREIKSVRDQSVGEELDVFIGMECSRGVVGVSEAREAWQLIFGDLEPFDLSREEMMVNAFNLKNEELGDNQTEKAKLREALSVLVEANPTNVLLRVILDSAISAAQAKSNPPMDLDKAYATLGDVVPEVDDDMLWMAYTIGVSDQPGQKDLLRGALEVIANHRNSELIKSYLAQSTATNNPSSSTQMIPYSPPTVSYDFPAGLNNIGNTCYLNSLLQYFFSVRELREVLLRFPEFEQDVEEDDLKEKKRVGGRIVSTPEIIRSKQFASQLQGLFHEMIHTPLSAVTPERELAFLALVLSKDESPSVLPLSNNHDSSASTDATLVDERLVMIGPVFNPLPSSPVITHSAASSTVLGKRKSESSGSDEEVEEGRNVSGVANATMLVEGNQLTKDPDLVMDGTTPAPILDRPPVIDLPEVIDLTEEPNGPPPALPPRPNRTRSLADTDSGSHMMFGRQNDVSECMDNCLFQIQAALDEKKVLAARGSEDEGNIVKSLFYGKTRQSLVFDTPDGKISVKEEPFAYLLVDVAEEGRDLYDGLDKVFDESEVELEHGKACRRVGLVDLPPILQIQLQRVQFDRKTHTIFKSNAHLKFEERLRMDRYLEPEPDDIAGIEKRTQTISRRKEIESLRGRAAELVMNVAGNKCTASSVLRDLASNLASVDTGGKATRMDFFNGLLGQNELEYLETEAVAIDEEIEVNEAKVKQLKAEVEELWREKAEGVLEESLNGKMTEDEDEIDRKKMNKNRPNKSAEYKLVSLFIHRGTAQGGHYWAIQRQLPDRPDRWLKYNDSQVNEIDAKIEVFKEVKNNPQHASEDTSNPYWLTYVRVGEENRFEMLKRAV